MINKCFACGCQPELVERRYGSHGDGRIDYYVECDCGARGKRFSNFDFMIFKNGYVEYNRLAYDKAKTAAVSSWNDLVNLVKEDKEEN